MSGEATRLATNVELCRGSTFRPSGRFLPGTRLLDALWPSLIASPVARLKIHDMQTLQVFSKSLAN
jgi:hypothetical protein